MSSPARTCNRISGEVQEAFGRMPARSLAVLRYVYDHMGSAWAAPLLEATAQVLASWVTQDPTSWSSRVDWMMVLYLTRKLQHGLPAPLGDLAAARREAVAALAGVFFTAGRLAQERSHPRLMAKWGAMARLPTELREQIAFQAHLIPLCVTKAHCKLHSL